MDLNKKLTHMVFVEHFQLRLSHHEVVKDQHLHIGLCGGHLLISRLRWHIPTVGVIEFLQELPCIILVIHRRQTGFHAIDFVEQSLWQRIQEIVFDFL